METDLPVKPDFFDCSYAGVNWAPSITCPPRPPKTAQLVAKAYWSWSPMNSRDDAYLLSSNKTRSHWILWWGYYDDNETYRYIYIPYAYGPRKGVPAKTAAVHLLLAGWQGDMSEFGSMNGPPHEMGEGLLSREQLDLLIKRVWPDVEPKLYPP